MSLVKFKAQAHPQQTAVRDVDDIDDRATHPDIFDEWDHRFGGFTLDVAASPTNTKCERFFTREQNGLAQTWADELVWCNPPYSAIAPWVRKAWEEWPASRGIVMLLPANRTEQSWWQELVEPRRDCADSPLRVEFIRGRIRFLKPGQTRVGKNERPPFGVCLLIWGLADRTAPSDPTLFESELNA